MPHQLESTPIIDLPLGTKLNPDNPNSPIAAHILALACVLKNNPIAAEIVQVVLASADRELEDLNQALSSWNETITAVQLNPGSPPDKTRWIDSFAAIAAAITNSYGNKAPEFWFVRLELLFDCLLAIKS